MVNSKDESLNELNHMYCSLVWERFMNKIINHYDPRIDRTLSIDVQDSYEKYGKEQLQRTADTLYIQSLPAEERAKTKFLSDCFTCPNCKKNAEVTSRKVTMTSGGLFWTHTELKDIYKCSACGSEFTSEELSREKTSISEHNYQILQHELSKEDSK